MTNFRDIKVQFIVRLANKRRNFVTLIRIIIGYINTNNRLFKIGISESPAYSCGFSSQDLNHLF